MTRRNFVLLLSGAWAGLPAVAAPRRRGRWIDACPTVIQTSDLDALDRCAARVILVNIAADPTWGPYGQQLSIAETANLRRALRGRDVRTITYIEGVGDCMVYVAAFSRATDGTIEGFGDDPSTARPVRTHWSWAAEGLPAGDLVRWVGIQASGLGEDFVSPRYTLKAIGVPEPRYPDGRAATGRRSDFPVPLDAELWDACAAKDLNGQIRPIFGPAVGVEPGVAPPPALANGLYRVIAGSADVDGPRVEPGTPVYCGMISVHKDLSAPFWREYARASARSAAKAGVDGVWCDNWSPWDNFGYPPIKHAFGDWSLHRAHQVMAKWAIHGDGPFAETVPARARDVPTAIKARAGAYGVKDASDLSDSGWSRRDWVSDPLWRMYKAARQICARADLEGLYLALHRGAREGGARDFAICSNDIPLYGLGWARERWTDMVHTETTPGWHMGAGTRGIMLPPEGKMAVVYKAAFAHQSGKACAAWYYLDGPHEAFRGKEGLARALLSEALANGAFLLCDPQQDRVAGSVETHAWMNRFVRQNEDHYVERTPLADTAIVFSPDCQLYELAPGGFPDMDCQPHVFGHWGWGTALLDAHVPYRVLPDWRLDPPSLRKLRTLVMPDVGCLADSAVAAIVRWVRGGGRLVATGACGTNHGADGAFRERTSDLLSVLGIRSGPGWAVASVGKGKVAHTAEAVGMDYYLKAHRRDSLLTSMVDAVGVSQLLPAVAAPKTVEVGLWRSGTGRSVCVDFANLAVDHGTDRVTVASGIGLDISLPWKGGARLLALSPDGKPDVRLTRSSTSTRLHVDGLMHFLTVVLAPA